MRRIHPLRRGIATLALGTILAGTPLALSVDTHGPAFGIAPAFAKDGDDDRGGDDNSGRGGGDDRGGSDDRDGDDNSGRGGDDDRGGRGGDNDRDDDRGGHGGDDDRGDRDDRSGHGNDGDDRDDDRGRRGRDDPSDVSRAAIGSIGGGGLQVVKVERGGGSVEVIYSNGVKEEIENGRYELKNAAGRTVMERPATGRDLSRINGNLRNSGLLPGRGVTAAPRLPANSQPASIEVGRNAIEVRYTTGWKEEISVGRYELKDPNNNTVVERRATAADRRRLLALAGG
jgi:hypothetical protein